MRNLLWDSEAIECRVRGLAATGDADGAATLALEAFGPGVLQYLSRVLPRDDAADAFAEFQQAVWRGLPHFRWECRLRAWLHRLTRHSIYHLARDAYRRRRAPLPPELHVEPPALEEGSHALERRSAQLASLVRRLEPDEQALLALRVERALRWEEVAEHLGGREVSTAGLRKRFERLKGKLAGLARAQGMVD